MAGGTGKANRIIAVTMVRDEADIIESFVRHTLCFADGLLVCDHRSTDGTEEILAKLQAEGLPLEVEVYTEPGYEQERVMTALLRRAVQERGADIVLLLDADEFLISPCGGIYHVRRFLQSLPLLEEAAWYRLDWYSAEPAEPEREAEKFMLARPVLRAREPEKPGKAIACRSAVEQHDLTVDKGNHALLLPENGAGLSAAPCERLDAQELYILHLPIRSQQHFLAKYLTDWLTWAARKSVYSEDGAVYHRTFLAQLAGAKPPWPHVQDTAPVEMASYAAEAELRYTKAGVDALANVLRVAEGLATAYLRETLRGREPGLALVLVCAGPGFSTAWLGKALDSALAQGYPLAQLVAIAAPEHCQAAEALLRARFVEGDCKLLPFSDLEALGESVQTPYVQWLLPGDVLLPGCWREMMLCLATNEARLMCFGIEPRSLAEGEIAPPLHKYLVDLPAVYKPGALFRQVFLRTGSHFPFALGSVIARREVFEAADFLVGAVRAGRLRQLSTWLILLQAAGERRNAVAFCSSPFLRQEHTWSCEEYRAYLADWERVLAFARGTLDLPEEAREEAEGLLAAEHIKLERLERLRQKQTGRNVGRMKGKV